MKKAIILFLALFAVALFSFAQSPNPSNWSIKGDLGTNSAWNFLGTIDNMKLVFRTNNVERASISETGLFFVQEQATGVYSPTTTTLPVQSSVFVITTAIPGAMDLVPFQEKGRYITIVNYSGTARTVNVPIQVASNNTFTTTIPNNQIYQIIWDGSKFIRF